MLRVESVAADAQVASFVHERFNLATADTVITAEVHHVELVRVPVAFDAWVRNDWL